MQSNPPKKLLDQVRDTMRRKHYAYPTEQSYVNWIKRNIIFHNKRHPQEIDHTEVEAFLTHLALTGVSASTQNQALSALLLLYREVAAKRVERIGAGFTGLQGHPAANGVDGACYPT